MAHRPTTEELGFSDRMTDTDALLWNMERDPKLRSTVTAIMLLDRSPDWDRIVDRAERLTRRLPRLRQRVVEPPRILGPPRYETDPDFDLVYHLRRVATPPPGGFRAVLDFAQATAMSGLDRNRPLWEYTLFEGLEDGRAALVQKVHHSMVDGVGGMQLALLTVDQERHPPDDDPMPEEPVPEHVGLMEFEKDALVRSAHAVVDTTMHAPGLIRRATSVLRNPVQSAADAGRLVASAARLLSPALRTCSPVMTERSTRWRYVALERPLDDLRRAAKAADASLNDAFVAAICGGLDRYQRRHGQPAAELRMTMPMNLRGDDELLGGNRLTTLRMLVPIDVTDPAERMEKIGEISTRTQHEPAVAITPTIAGLLNKLPERAMTLVFAGMFEHVDFLASNVPGIPSRCYIGGAEVLRWYAFGPTEGAAVNVTLMSHGQTCCIGVNCDAAAVPDPDVLADCFDEGFDEIVALGTADPS
ncbi:MAG: wax ester/triacylglycerol synthase family O-acyltransferase [Acidimicrobiia bacterium]